MPGRAREEAWKEKERGQENRQAEGGAAMDREAGMQRRKGRDRGGAAMDREGGMERDGSMRGGAAELGAAMEAGVPPQELAAAAVARRGPVEALMSAMRQMPEGMEKPRKKRMLARIGVEDIQEATARLMRYKQGKAVLDSRIAGNEEWWKLRHWEEMAGRPGQREEIRPASAWLFNTLLNKHADAMDNYPEPVVLPRSRDDEREAKQLTSILPVVLEKNGYEAVYDAMWWYKLKFGTGVQGVFWNPRVDNGAGDIDVRSVDLLNLFWEPGVKDIQDSRDFFCLAVVPVEALRDAYGDKVKEVRGGWSVQPMEYRHEDNREQGDKAVVVDWYYKKNQDGRRVLHYCKYVDSVILYASENDPDYAQRGYYDHGQYPFVFDPMFPVEDSPAGMGYIDVLRQPQAYIDQMNAIMLKNAHLAGRPRFMVKNASGVNEEEFSDWGKDFVHAEGNLGEDAVRQITVEALPQSVYALYENKIEELKQVSGNDDFTRGSASSGVTAASAIAALQEAGSKLSRDMIKSSYRAFAKVCELCVELIRQFYTEPRTFRITGEKGGEDFTTYASGGIQEQSLPEYGMESARKPVFDLKIKSQKSSPFSRIAQNETAKELYGMGIFQPANADQALMVLDMMDFEGKAQVVEKVRGNGTMYQQMQQMAQQLQQLSVIVDRLTGSGLTQAMDAPVTGQAGSPGAGGKASPLTAAVQGGAGVTATTARDKAQQAAQPR